MLKRGLIAVIVLGAMLTACSDKDAGKEGLRGQAACLSTPSPIADAKFPTPFPEISDVTWTASNELARRSGIHRRRAGRPVQRDEG